MTCLDDPRPLPEVLADWVARHGGTAWAVSRDARPPGPLSVSDQVIRRWLRGAPCPMEREVRALMTMADEGRVAPLPVAVREDPL